MNAVKAALVIQKCPVFQWARLYSRVLETVNNALSKFSSQRTRQMELSATSIVVTGPVIERLQVGTEDKRVLDSLAPLRRLNDSGARYKYPDLLTYLLT